MRPSYLSPTQCSVAEFNVDFVRKRKLDDVESIACAEYAASRTKAQPSALKFEAHASGAGAVHKGLKIVPMKGKQLAALQASKAEGVLQREAVPPILPAAWRPCRRRTKAPLQPQPPNDMSGRRAAPCREIPSHPMLLREWVHRLWGEKIFTGCLFGRGYKKSLWDDCTNHHPTSTNSPTTPIRWW